MKNEYKKAVDYIQRSGLEKQINIIYGDALETVVNGSYDMIFI